VASGELQYNAANGYLTGIKTGLYAAPSAFKESSFHYNDRGDMVSRDDAVSGSAETFTYLNGQLEGWEISRGGRSHAETYGYDGLGNITAKTSAGQLVYDADTNQLESRITPDGVLIDDYRYDANGNMESGDGRTYQ
jgi:YD repeat-containing protein